MSRQRDKAEARAAALLTRGVVSELSDEQQATIKQNIKDLQVWLEERGAEGLIAATIVVSEAAANEED